MSTPLSEPPDMPKPALAIRKTRRSGHGFAARTLLSRMLLVFDGTAIRQRHYESCLDCGYRFLRCVGKSARKRSSAQQCRWGGLDHLRVSGFCPIGLV